VGHRASYAAFPVSVNCRLHRQELVHLHRRDEGELGGRARRGGQRMDSRTIHPGRYLSITQSDGQAGTAPPFLTFTT
jgi:hypothetical protein